MRSDSILEESWVYQELKQEFMGKGREEERQQALQRERRTLLDIIRERFPEIVELAKKQLDTIDDPEVLHHLTVKASIVQTAEEARQHLLTSNKDEKETTATTSTKRRKSTVTRS